MKVYQVLRADNVQDEAVFHYELFPMDIFSTKEKALSYIKGLDLVETAGIGTIEKYEEIDPPTTPDWEVGLGITYVRSIKVSDYHWENLIGFYIEEKEVL